MSGRWSGWGVALAVAVALASFGGELLAGDPTRAWGALLVSWLFFTGAAVGVVALQAVIALSGGEWAEPVLRPNSALVSFLPWAGALLLLLLLGREHWLLHPGAPGTFRAAWLAPTALAVREIVGTTALFVLATRLARRPAGGARAVIYLVVYAVVLSFWALDFVVSLDLEWTSTLAGGHIFVGAWASGAALLALLAEARGEATPKLRQDMGRVVFVAAAIWGYLMWSQFLPVWYGNLPDEIRFALARSDGGWGLVSLLVVALILVVPFVATLGVRARATSTGMIIAAGGMTAGLWLERLLLIMPSEVPGGVPFVGAEIAIALALGIALVLPVFGLRAPGRLDAP